MSETILHIEEIVSNPAVRGGRPVIRGTGLRVVDIVHAHYGPDHLTAEEIADHYGITVGQAHAALAYYHLHKDEIDAAIRADEADAERLLKQIEAQGKLLHFD